MTSIVAFGHPGDIGRYHGRTVPRLSLRVHDQGLMLLLLALAGGCARQATPPPTPPPSAPTPSPAPADETLPPPQAQAPPPSPGPCAADGRLWDGKPADCSYEHAGCCYGSAATACAAAGCAEAGCQVLESYPAQIRCEAP
jgi:hypothetical protein